MPEYDLRAYLATQRQETYRACIIHAPAMGHKTETARRLRDTLGAYLFDLQAHFAERPELAVRIARFDTEDLQELLLKLDVPQPVVVVDNLDFLLNTWSQARRKRFVGLVDLVLKSPGVTDKTFVFMVQTDPVITGQALVNTRGTPRILPLDAFYAL
jgi:hypothetical protein